MTLADSPIAWQQIHGSPKVRDYRDTAAYVMETVRIKSLAPQVIDDSAKRVIPMIWITKGELAQKFPHEEPRND